MKLKSRKLTGGQAAIKSLRKEQVKHVFGLIGSATMEMFDAIYHDKKIKFIDVRDERTGTHMADGYARASNQPGVIIAGQNGPGATNLVTGLAQAKAAFSPVISLAGLYSTKDKMEDAFQGLDQQSLFEPVTKKTITLKNSKNIPNAISDGFNVAMSPRRGPVCINLPRNLLAEKNNYKINEKIKSFKNINNTQSNPKSIKRAAKLISNSSKVIIIVGGGIKYTSGFKPVIKLAEYLKTKLTKEADIILAIGTRLGFNSTFYSFENINKKAKIIQVELEKKMLGKYFPIKIGINADAATTANQLLREFKKQKIKSEVKIWTEKFKNERSNYLFQRNNIPSKNYPIQPPGLFKELRKVLPKNSAITLDAGTLCLQATDALEYYNPPSLFTPLDFGLVGFSFACGLGVKVAKPKKTVVSLMGDGGFGMTISELSTAVEHKINTITIVMNNKSWGAEKAYQKDFFGKRYLGADISSPPFSKVAELYGAKGYKVKRLSEINDAVKSALKVNKPVVIDVDVDPKALYSFRRDSFKHRSK